MIAVIFELEPKPGMAQRYFDLANSLKASLMSQDGFVSLERFESVSQPGHYLSLSFWRDEAAVSAWRNMAAHRAAQCQGRDQVFAFYRLRVAQVIRDHGLSDRAQAPADSLDACVNALG
jgi:heme-degrading monooxygenase HmoA